MAMSTESNDSMRSFVLVAGGATGMCGKGSMRSAELYDVDDDEWRSIADMVEARRGACSVVFRGAVYVMGGFNGTRYLSSCERYDAAANAWTLVAPMRQRRSCACAVATDAFIYVMGGWNGIDALDNVSRYDPIADEWTEMPPLSIPRKNASAVLITEARLSPPTTTTSPSGVPDLMSAESQHHAQSFPQSDSHHRLLSFGPSSPSSKPHAKSIGSSPFFDHILRALSPQVLQSLDVTQASMSSFPPPVPSHGTPVSSTTQRILVVGGWDESSTLRVNECLRLGGDDGVESKWKREATMLRNPRECSAIVVAPKSAARAADSCREIDLMPTPTGSAATALGQHDAFVLGGWNGSELLKTVERLDLSESAGVGAAVSSWHEVPEMAFDTPMECFSSTVVNNAIVTVGGWHHNTAQATCQSYDRREGGGGWRTRSPMKVGRNRPVAEVIRLPSPPRLSIASRL